MGKSPAWLAPGVASLMLFAYLLTRVDVAFAGRSYAAYGGIYICSSVAWLRFVERVTPTAADFAGLVLCLAGTAVILYGAWRV